jgi:CheY-like chemotaxis protein
VQGKNVCSRLGGTIDASAMVTYGGPRVLIVEDSALVAMEAEALLSECGCSVVGPVATVARGLATVQQTDLDGALLDINLGEERVWPVAELLEQRGVPFLLATGYDASEVPTRFRERPLLSKPLTQRALQQALAKIGVINS